MEIIDKDGLIYHLSRMLQMYSVALQFVVDDCVRDKEQFFSGYMKMGDDYRSVIAEFFEGKEV